MKEQFVLTGINRLSGFREEISRPMSREDAEIRLEREKASRKHQRYQPHRNLRIEKRLPVQLSLNFQNQSL